MFVFHISKKKRTPIQIDYKEPIKVAKMERIKRIINYKSIYN